MYFGLDPQQLGVLRDLGLLINATRPLFADVETLSPLQRGAFRRHFVNRVVRRYGPLSDLIHVEQRASQTRIQLGDLWCVPCAVHFPDGLPRRPEHARTWRQKAWLSPTQLPLFDIPVLADWGSPMRPMILGYFDEGCFLGTPEYVSLDRHAGQFVKRIDVDAAGLTFAPPEPMAELHVPPVRREFIRKLVT